MTGHGSCHCGPIRFTAGVDPQLTSVCRGNGCQQLAGSALSVSIQALGGTFQLRCGELKGCIKVAVVV